MGPCFYATGNCTAGQYCQGGAASPVPNDSNVDYPENGPCQVGHYCPEGTLVPVECEIGTLRNVTGMCCFINDASSLIVRHQSK